MEYNKDQDHINPLYNRLNVSNFKNVSIEKEKYQLLEETLNYVNENAKEELTSIFFNYDIDVYSIVIFKTFSLCLKLLHNGIEVNYIVELLNSLRLTPFMIREVTYLLIHFSNKGNELKEYLETHLRLSTTSKEIYFNSSYLMGREVQYSKNR